jgi:5'-3' exonuclease
MGIKDFSKAFSSYRGPLEWKDLANSSIAVDAMTEIHRSALGTKSIKTLTDNKGNPTIHINVIISTLLAFRKNNIKSIWVFDSKTQNTDKKEELEKRKKIKEKAKEKLQKMQDELDEEFIDDKELDKIAETTEIIENINKQEKRTFSLSPHYIEDIQKILTYLGIPYVHASKNIEGEQLASHINRIGRVDHVYSGDTDPIPYGAKSLIRRNPRNKKLYQYKQSDILNQISQEVESTYIPNITTIRKICSILGSDFSKRTRGVGPKTVLRKFRTIQLSDDQKKAIKIFSTIPNIKNVRFKNENAEYFKESNVRELIDWLVSDKSFNRARIEKLFFR